MTQNNECWILPESVSLTVCDAGREAVLDQMIALLERTGCVRDKKILKTDLLNREALGSVDIGEDVSMPHAQSQGVSRFCASIAVTQKKRICLLTAWPSVSYKELKTIAAFIELFKDERKKKELFLAETAQELFEKIKTHLAGYGINA